MTDAIDFLRTDVLRKRIGGFAGGNRIVWSEKDLVEIHDHVMTAKREEILSATRPIETKRSTEPLDISKLEIEVKSDIGPTDNPVFVISSPRVDLALDSVNVSGIDLTDFRRNSAVLDSHARCDETAHSDIYCAVDFR